MRPTKFEVGALRTRYEPPALAPAASTPPSDQVSTDATGASISWRATLTELSHVFTFRGKPVAHMLNSAWKRAREKADLRQVRVRDLKHTFGRRLRAAGVSFEYRQDLLEHRSGRITTHYSAAELSQHIEVANAVCDKGSDKPELVVLRRLSVS